MVLSVVLCSPRRIIDLFFFLQRAMEDLGMTQTEIMDIFRIMAAILKLGNVNFIPTTNMDGTEGCAISNDYGKLFSTTTFCSIPFDFFNHIYQREKQQKIKFPDPSYEKIPSCQKRRQPSKVDTLEKKDGTIV